MDRLHTCYAPVRRSPPWYCYHVLPLDLHVLGLSLAFILSQDQTLRCKIIITLLRMSNLLSVLWRELVTMRNSQCVMRNGIASYFPEHTPYILYKACSLVLHLLLQCFKDHFVVLSCSQPRGVSFARKRLQNYCFCLDWPNLQSFFQHFLCKRLIFSIHQHYRLRGILLHSLVLTAKTAAKLLLLSEPTKYQSSFFAFSL